MKIISEKIKKFQKNLDKNGKPRYNTRTERKETHKQTTLMITNKNLLRAVYFGINRVLREVAPIVGSNVSNTVFGVNTVEIEDNEQFIDSLVSFADATMVMKDSTGEITLKDENGDDIIAFNANEIREYSVSGGNKYTVLNIEYGNGHSLTLFLNK